MEGSCKSSKPAAGTPTTRTSARGYSPAPSDNKDLDEAAVKVPKLCNLAELLQGIQARLASADDI